MTVKFDKAKFFEFLASRKCSIQDFDSYLSEVENVITAKKLLKDDEFLAVLYLVGRQKYCVTLGDISEFFGISVDDLLSTVRKLSRKYGLKYRFNTDMCIKRAIEYCGIRDEDAEETIKKFMSIFRSGRPDILVAFSVGFIYNCDATRLFGTSLSALKYHLNQLFSGPKGQGKHDKPYPNGKDEDADDKENVIHI